jgi:vitamin B12 transporter
VFYKMGTNIIDWVVLPGDSLTESKNLTKLNTSGFELSVSYRADAQFLKNVGLSYAFVNQDKVAVGFDSRYALDYLRHKVTLNLQHSIYNNISANWFASYNDRNGTYTDFATGMLVDYKPYFMLNLRIEAPAKYYTVFADINNIFNTNFADFGGLTQPGRHFNAGIRFHL